MADLWYEDDISSVEGNDLIVNEYDISSVPNDFNITTIYNLIESGIVKIPDFQRNYVWDQKRASKLIESIILGLPIPQVFFYESEKNNYLIIDGQQRLLSIYFFIKQRFPKATARNIIRQEFEEHHKITDSVLGNDEYFTNFTLKLSESGIVSPYNGHKFSTLDSLIRNQFEHMRTIRSIVIRQNAPDDSDSSMFEIFNRLNTGGQNLTAQEIRASLFYSEFYDMMYKINQNPKWRLILQKNDVDLHCKDIEFILRAFALCFDFENYSPSMLKYLNRFSKIAKLFHNERIEYYENLFLSFLESCELLPKDAFCTYGRFNISLFDAVFAATCNQVMKDGVFITGKIDPDSFAKLKSDDAFIEFTQSGTASKKSILGRIEIAQQNIKLQ